MTNRDDSNLGAPRRQLSLLDATSIIVGIVVGAGIYRATPIIASSVASPVGLLGVWLAGGAIALVGAMCYAELTTAYPREGGEYIYLQRAYGRSMGFLFSWAQLWIVRPGSIGVMAYVFAEYANQLVPLGTGNAAIVIYAAGSVAVVSFVNLFGVREGKGLQNALNAVKLLGLAGILVVALTSPAAAPPAAPITGGNNWYLAMILVLLTYGGWNDMSYVAAEVREPNRNLVRALLGGTLAIVVIYLALNFAFLHVLGFDGLRNSSAVAADAVAARLGPWGGKAISGLICISCLGAINGMIFTGARVYYAVGQEHRLFKPFAVWNARFDTPHRALLLQAVITLAVVIGFGVYEQGFERMVNFTTPIFWLFILLVGVSLFILRYKDADLDRPYRVPGYPLTPLLFIASCLFTLYASLEYAYSRAAWEAAWAIGLMLVGLALSLVESRLSRSGTIDDV